jgi:hypothetical protein
MFIYRMNFIYLISMKGHTIKARSTTIFMKQTGLLNDKITYTMGLKIFNKT